MTKIIMQTKTKSKLKLFNKERTKTTTKIFSVN